VRDFDTLQGADRRGNKEAVRGIPLVWINTGRRSVFNRVYDSINLFWFRIRKLLPSLSTGADSFLLPKQAISSMLPMQAMKRPNPEDYMPMIYKLCNKYKTFHGVVSYDDIIGIAKLTLMKAIESYDPTKGDFLYYASMKVRFGIMDELRRLPEWDRHRNEKRGRKCEDGHNPVNWEDYYCYSDNSSLSSIEVAEIKDIRNQLDDVDIPFRDKYVLRMLYMNGFSVVSLAKEMNLTRGTVCRLRVNAIKALRDALFISEEIEG